MTDRLSGAWSRLSTPWKVLGAVLTVVGAVWTAALAYAAKSAEYATDAEVSAGDVKVAADAREALSPVQSAVRQLQKFDAAIVAEREREQFAKAAERKQWIAVFKHLVSIQAADAEDNKLRKAEASKFAKTAYAAAIKAGSEPEEAAEQALDTLPPWRVGAKR
jgi:hypothetical protein